MNTYIKHSLGDLFDGGDRLLEEVDVELLKLRPGDGEAEVFALVQRLHFDLG